MKVVVTCRTRNEEKNIARFCECHSWADKIFIADGGSEDNTISIAKQFPNVEVRNFAEKIKRPTGIWRNPHGRHMNFMFQWAKNEGHAQWIIFDDCDCVPTKALQGSIRSFIDQATDENKRAIFLHRLYIYGQDRYFPKMNLPGQSLWAWKADCGIHAEEANPWAHVLLDIPPDRLILEQPYSCLHYFCPDEETVDKKLKFYRESFEIPEFQHPLQFGGQLAPLPDWAVYK